MKLTTDLRRVLDTIIVSTPDVQCRFYSVRLISDAAAMDVGYLFSALDELNRLNLIEYAPNETYFALNERGRNYKEYQRIERCEFWKNHLVKFVFGFISGLLTGILLSWLLGILQLPNL